MSDTTYRAFFGDSERTFKLTTPMIVELERKCGAGVGALCRRLFAREFNLADISETIRLALIGGGEKPERANELVVAYVQNQPLMESYPLAVSILEALFFGTKRPATDEQKAPDGQA